MADIINQYDDMLSVDDVDSWVILDTLTLLKEQDDALEQAQLDNKDLRKCYAELLKEQEAVEPSFKQDEKGIFVWCCGSCGAYMYHIYDGIDKAKEYAKFCRKCGKPVLWEGR